MGGSNVATADTLPRFPRTTLTVQLDADIKTNVDLAILTPFLYVRNAGLGRAFGFQFIYTCRYREDANRRVSDWRSGTDWFRNSEQHQR
jgi:hypothetical protein